METFATENVNQDVEPSDAIDEALDSFNDDKYRVMFMAPEACETDHDGDDGAYDDRFTIERSPDILVLDESVDEKPMTFGTLYNLKFKFFVPNQKGEEQRKIRINMIFD